MKNNIFSFFHDSYINSNKKVALNVDNVDYTYEELFFRVCQVSAVLRTYQHERVGIFGLRSLTCYQAILGTLAAGKTYIPLNPKFPVERNKTIIALADLEIFVADHIGLEQIVALAEHLKKDSILLCPNMNSKDIPDVLKTKFKIFTSDTMLETNSMVVEVENDKPAYIMFTSGSTGIPKGVPVSHKNVRSYIDYQKFRYEFDVNDRFTQTFDLTFDLSVHDLFLCWSVGASLYIIPEKVLMAPAKFIKENKITVWFSVPSLAQFMKRFKMLKDNNFPELRYSLFCGEALPKTIAAAWQTAAPNSIVENIYGPTETTIGITHYRVPREEDKILEYNGIVSIGEVFHTQDFCLIDEHNERTKDFGELCLAGSQVTAGYLNNAEKTEEAFFKFKNDNRLWYKTGDIVKFENNNLFYISRKDFQVKIRGYRIELDEINMAIRNFTNCDLIYTIPYPLTSGIAENLFSFIDCSCTIEKNMILKYLKNKLPEYMVPKDIFFTKEFPLNSNGKVDLKKLTIKIDEHGKSN